MKTKLQLNAEFIEACKSGELETVKILLSQPGVHGGMGLRRACEYGHLDTVKYLLESPKIQMYEKKDSAFKLAVIFNQLHIANYLIMEYGMELTADIKDFLKREDCNIEVSQKVENMFNLRKLNQTLNTDLPKNQTVQRTKKI